MAREDAEDGFAVSCVAVLCGCVGVREHAPEMMRRYLDTGPGEVGKAVAKVLGVLDRKDRKEFGREEIGLLWREPELHLPREREMRRERANEFADPGSSRHDDGPCFDASGIGQDRDGSSFGFHAVDARMEPQIGAGTLRNAKEGADGALRTEQSAFLLKHAAPPVRQVEGGKTLRDGAAVEELMRDAVLDCGLKRVRHDLGALRAAFEHAVSSRTSSPVAASRSRQSERAWRASAE